MVTLALTLLLCSVLTPAADSAMVADFQTDGRLSISTFMKTPIRIDYRTQPFTVCTWLRVYHFREMPSYPLTFGSRGNIEAFHLDVGRLKQGRYTTGLRLKFCLEPQTDAKGCLNIDMKQSYVRIWYHFCFVVENNRTLTGKDGAVRTSDVRGFVNGAFNASYTLPWAAPAAGSGVGGGGPEEGLLLLGQDPDIYGDLFDEKQAFSGSLACLGVWSRALTDPEIAEQADCSKEDRAGKGDIVSWIDKAQWTVSQVPIHAQANFCSAQHFYVFLPTKMSHEESVRQCGSFGGELPGDLDWNKQTVVSYEDIKQACLDQLGVEDNPCMVPEFADKTFKFWTDFKIKDGNVVVNSRGDEVIRSLGKEAVSRLTASADVKSDVCLYAYHRHLKASNCNVGAPCTVCKVEASRNMLFLKGLCTLETDVNFDTTYTINAVQNKRLRISGLQHSQIVYNNQTLQWNIRSYSGVNASLNLSGFKGISQVAPLGRNRWDVSAGIGASLCGVRDGGALNLTLSMCGTKKFTCDDGTCLESLQLMKCNNLNECQDESDEAYCSYLAIKQSYNQDLSPLNATNATDKLFIYLSIHVYQFRSINPVEQKFTSNFNMMLRWYDQRLKFYDLNADQGLNTLGHKEMDQIWTPVITFTNALGFTAQADDTTRIGINKEKDGRFTDFDVAVEGALFEGVANSLWTSKKYFIDFSCDFDLLLYPFDTQICYQVFSVPSGLELVPDQTATVTITDRSTVEYEITGLKIVRGSSCLSNHTLDKVSTACVKVVFRRKLAYHISNTYLQTLLLIAVGFMIFFYDLDDFADRTMVLLTTMLVVATLMVGIQSGLPKTAYYKLIDYWLMFTLNMLIGQLAFQTYFGYVVRKERQAAEEAVQANLFSVPQITFVTGQGRDSKLCRIDGSGGAKNRPPTMVELDRPKRINMMGFWIFLAIFVAFNLGYWSYAMSEYCKQVPN